MYSTRLKDVFHEGKRLSATSSVSMRYAQVPPRHRPLTGPVWRDSDVLG